MVGKRLRSGWEARFHPPSCPVCCLCRPCSDGTPRGVQAHTRGYSGPRKCGGARNASTGTLDRACDNFAFPNGSRIVYSSGMTDPDAYAPLPNALLYNWCSIFVLGFGNLCALDFQVRCRACVRSISTIKACTFAILIAFR